MSEDTTKLSQPDPGPDPDKTAEAEVRTPEPEQADTPVDEGTAADAKDGRDLSGTLDEATEAWDDPQPESQPDAKPTPAPAPAAQKRGGGFLAPLIGGVLAAGVGYGAAQYVKPEGWPFPGAGLGDDARAALASADERLSATQDQVAALQAQVASLAENAGGGAQALAPELAALTDQLAALTDRLNTLDGRVTELAKAQVAVAGEEAAEAVAAYEREIAAMREELAAQRDENAKLAESVASVANQAEAEVDAAMDRAAQVEARAAMMRIDAALANGAPFEAALGQLQGVELPQALAAVAAQGAATLAELQRDFPAAARAALDAALPVEADGSVGDRVSAFVRSQLGLRSLEPRDGDDADAVLSRSEAALRQGDLPGALAELDALPDPAKSAMSGWVEAATARVDALEAARALEQSLNQ
ncbi:mitofilin family membrane protein [Rhodovulum marinum]|nr:mitofilin family membrane protein [Rhodovulum marinum]